MIRALRLLRPPLLSVPTFSTGATTRFASSFSLLVPCTWIIEQRLAWEFSSGVVEWFLGFQGLGFHGRERLF
jgi:hypothetical protein